MSFTQGPIPINENVSLWRYVPLATLFHYLAGKVFVPAIEKLQECDPTEGLRVVNGGRARVGFSDVEWASLLKYIYDHRLTPAEKQQWDCNGHDAELNGMFLHYEKFLAESRYAWCWFNSPHESAAMWQLYGKGGAAVRTSGAQLGNVLGHDGKKWLASGVKYLDHGTDAGISVGWGHPSMDPWARRPFLVKRLEYRHEEEVRLVTVSAECREGILLEDISPEKWIEEVVFWPGFPRSEAKALAETVKKLVPSLDEKTRVSKLFQRDPKHCVSDLFDGLVDDLVAKSGSQEASKWPTWLHEP